MPGHAASSPHVGGRGNSVSLDVVRKLHQKGFSDERVRAKLQKMGFKKARISQLVKTIHPASASSARKSKSASQDLAHKLHDRGLSKEKVRSGLRARGFKKARTSQLMKALLAKKVLLKRPASGTTVHAGRVHQPVKIATQVNTIDNCSKGLETSIDIKKLVEAKMITKSLAFSEHQPANNAGTVSAHRRLAGIRGTNSPKRVRTLPGEVAHADNPMQSLAKQIKQSASVANAIISAGRRGDDAESDPLLHAKASTSRLQLQSARDMQVEPCNRCWTDSSVQAPFTELLHSSNAVGLEEPSLKHRRMEQTAVKSAEVPLPLAGSEGCMALLPSTESEQFGIGFAGRRAPVRSFTATIGSELCSYLRGAILTKWNPVEMKPGSRHVVNWHTVERLPDPSHMFVPMHGRFGTLHRAPSALVAFSAAFRQFNAVVWEELARRLTAADGETSGASLLFAEALRKQQHFGVWELQYYRGGRHDCGWHRDGCTSLLHLGVALGGTRQLTTQLSHSPLRDGDKKTATLNVGDVYFSSPALFNHGVVYENCNSGDGASFSAQLRTCFLDDAIKELNGRRNANMYKVAVIVSDTFRGVKFSLPSLAHVQQFENHMLGRPGRS
jgi:hypothetical protein